MIELCKLPYDYAALEPVISARTMQFHHDKHHAAYVKKANDLAAKAGLEDLSVEDLIRKAKEGGDKKLYNNAAQIWNHGFFWQSMTGDSLKPMGDLEAAISSSFGDLAALNAKFIEEGVAHFGSGWVWLVAEGGKLSVESTHDAADYVDQPEKTPLLVCDLWEHAYYLDHQNDREGFLKQWVSSLANWQFAGAQFAAAKAGETGYVYPHLAHAHA
ncbi:MAG: superoxide dismutase [Novosphingobium sp.]